MKAQHIAAYRSSAQTTLQMLNIKPGQDFNTLSATQLEGLLEEAIRVKYQKPAGAKASRARYFHNRLQKHAQLKG